MSDVIITGRIYDVKATIVDAVTAYGASMPASEKAAALSALSVASPVDCIAQFADAAYSALKKGAVSDTTAQQALAQALGQAVYQVINNGFGHIAADRAQGYYAFARRSLGATTTPDPSADPSLPVQFNPPAPTPVVAPAS